MYRGDHIEDEDDENKISEATVQLSLKITEEFRRAFPLRGEKSKRPVPVATSQPFLQADDGNSADEEQNYYTETLSTLQSSSNCRKIENKVYANEDLSGDTVKAYKAEIKRLREELGSIEGRIRAEMDDKLAAVQEEMEQWKQLAIGRERALLEARLQRDLFAAQLPGGPSNEGERPQDEFLNEVKSKLAERIASIRTYEELSRAQLENDLANALHELDQMRVRQNAEAARKAFAEDKNVLEGVDESAKTALSASEPTVSAVAKDTSSSDTFDSDEPKELFDGHVGQDKTNPRGIALKVIKLDNTAAQTLLACELKIGSKTIQIQWTSDTDTLVFSRELLKKNHLNPEYDAILVFQFERIIELLHEGSHRMDGLVLTTLIEPASECVPAPPDLKVCEACGSAMKPPAIHVTTSKKRKYLYPLSSMMDKMSTPGTTSPENSLTRTTITPQATPTPPLNGEQAFPMQFQMPFFANPFMSPFMPQQGIIPDGSNVGPAAAGTTGMPAFFFSPAQYQEMMQQYFTQMMSANQYGMNMAFPMPFATTVARPNSQASQLESVGEAVNGIQELHLASASSDRELAPPSSAAFQSDSPTTLSDKNFVTNGTERGTVP